MKKINLFIAVIISYIMCSAVNAAATESSEMILTTETQTVEAVEVLTPEPSIETEITPEPETDASTDAASVELASTGSTSDIIDEYNNLYYPQTIYNGGVNAVPSQTEQEAFVDPATGSTHVKVTDITLPGVNGFDLSLTRLYDSSNSALFEPCVKPTTKTGKGYRNGLLDSTPTERYSRLGSGWEFAFPYIEVRYGYGEYKAEYLHFGDKGVYQIDLADDSENNLVAYELNDIMLTSDTTVTHDSKRSKYCVTEKNGTKHYFAADGRLLLQRDRYGNEIKFYCDTEFYFDVWGENREYPYITKIVDTVGREIEFSFESDGSYGKYYNATVTDPSDADNTKVIGYYLEKYTDDDLNISLNDDDDLLCTEWLLTDVYVCDERYYTYSYDLKVSKFSFLSKNESFYYDNYENYKSYRGNSFLDEKYLGKFNGEYNMYALLTDSVDVLGRSYYFEYAPFIKNCSQDGSMIFYKVYRQHNKSGNAYSDESYKMNDKQYYYDMNSVGEYDGYITYDSNDNIGSSYVYKVKVEESNLETGEISYDEYQYKYRGAAWEKTILLTRHSDIGTDHKIVTSYTYNSETKLPTKITTVVRSVSDTSQYITSTVSYTYDDANYGDILTQTLNSDEERKITYTYDDTYHFPVSKTYKQDADTTIRETYNVTDDGKSIEQINVYVNNSLKNRTTYSHDSYGNIINEKKYINSTEYVETDYVYENGANLISQTTKNVTDNDNTSGNITVNATYDYWGNPITQTDANGNITSYVYDDINRITRVINPDGTQKQYEYGYDSDYVKETDEQGLSIRSHYKDNYFLYKWYSEYNLEMSQVYYTPQGEVSAEVTYTDEQSDGEMQIDTTTLYTYDTNHRPVSKEVYDSDDVLSYKETYAYELTSDYRKTTKTVCGGASNPSVTVSEYYDRYGNKIKTESASATETYTSDYMGNIVTVKSARANANGWEEVHTTEYDHMGNVVKETNELGVEISAEYDRLGRMTKSYDANGYATEYKYDKLGRLIEQRTPFEENDGTVSYSVKKMWYDGNGNLIKERVLTNASGESESYSEVKYTYDNRNRLIMTETNDGAVSNYTQNYYSVRGELLRVYTGLTSPLTINGLDDVTENGDSDYAVTKYTYDIVGNLISTEDASGNVETNECDLVTKRVEKTTDRNRNTFVYTYNGLGNVVSTSLANGSSEETTTYGLTGQVLSKSNDTTTISYSYDNMGRLITETDSAQGTVKTYTYDEAGNRLTFTLTKDAQTQLSQSYTYDKLNRLTGVSENGAEIASYSYDDKNNRIQTVSGGETTSYSYNIANLITGQTTGEKLNEEYTYYLNGNCKSKTTNGETTSYSYDGMNRLIVENNTSYTFDDYGNRATKTDGIATTTYTYDKNNRLTGSCETSESATKTAVYTYDPNGNQLSKYAGVITESTENGETVGISDKTNSNVVLYSYDKYNRLKSVDTNGVKTSYSYAPDGLRYSKTADGNTTTFVYDNANIVAEITAEGTNKYYRGIEIIKNDDNLYYIYNGQGDVAMLTDTAGTPVADYEFDAYGNSDSESAVYNPFGYRGEYQDAESGLIYLRARMYDPETGRFINEDPIKDGLNWYIYCSGNPVMFVDPSGYLRAPGYNKYGQWSDNPDMDDFGADSATYKMLFGLTTAYERADTYGHWEGDKERIAELAATLRVTDTGITDVILLNNSKGAIGAGHNAMLLLNSMGQGFFFSYYSANSYPSDVGEMRFSVLSVNEVKELKDKSGSVNEAVTIYGDRRWETNNSAYDRFVWSDLSSISDGEKIFKNAAEVFLNPGGYWLLGRQCDYIAGEILKAGNIGYDNELTPNQSYDKYKNNRTYWINENGVNRGVQR